MSQTSPNPTTYNAGCLAAINASSNSVPLALSVGGINYIKVFCDMYQRYKAAHVSLPGCVETTLLGIIPVYDLPGSAMNNYDPVVGIDFVEIEELAKILS